MLRSFKEQLRLLASDPQDPFRAHLRKRVGKRATTLLEKKIKRMILMMPSLVSRVYDLWSTLEASSKVKKAGGFLLAYMYHPDDFLPEATHGLFGYLDDAYFVITVYELVNEEQRRAGFRVPKEDQALLEELQQLKKAARIVIPREIQRIEKMVKEVIEENQTTYLEAFGTRKAAA